MTTSASRSRWSAAEDEEVRRQLAAGQSPCAIARGMGRSESSVYRRIEVLSRATSPGRRPCLCCGTPFNSEGAHNRLCGRCRTREKTPFDF